MSPVLRRIVSWAAPTALLVAGVAFALRPQPVAVDFAAVVEGPLATTVAEDGRTRIRDVFLVSAPVSGRALRIEIEEGQPVSAGETVLAEIKPVEPTFLDVRTEAEARVAVETARAAVDLAGAELTQARAELAFAQAEVVRQRRLRKTGAVTERALQDAERAFRSRRAAVETAKAGVAMRRSELAAAEVRLQPPRFEPHDDECPCIPIRAPVDGQVLRVLHESEGVVSAGLPLVEIGDPSDLEIVADFLSADAVRIEPGQRVIIEGWGGPLALQGEVAKVEPYAFTKVSALGIEEQRVNVVIDLVGPPTSWARLGHGFEVDARIVLWETDAALKIPLTALFRDGRDWATFAVEEGRARLQKVEVGARGELEAAINSGLNAGDVVVRYPHAGIGDGDRVTAR